MKTPCSVTDDCAARFWPRLQGSGIFADLGTQTVPVTSFSDCGVQTVLVCQLGLFVCAIIRRAGRDESGDVGALSDGMLFAVYLVCVPNLYSARLLHQIVKAYSSSHFERVT